MHTNIYQTHQYVYLQVRRWRRLAETRGQEPGDDRSWGHQPKRGRQGLCNWEKRRRGICRTLVVAIAEEKSGREKDVGLPCVYDIKSWKIPVILHRFILKTGNRTSCRIHEYCRVYCRTTGTYPVFSHLVNMILVLHCMKTVTKGLIRHSWIYSAIMNILVSWKFHLPKRQQSKMWQYPVQTAKKSSSRWGSTCSRWNPAGNEVCDTIPEYFRFSCNRTDLLFVTREGSKERHVMTVVLTRCDDMLSGCGLRDGCCYRRTANGVGNCRRQIFLLLLVECS